MNEIMLEGAGYFDEPPDCQHDWRIEFTIDDERNGFYQARCMQCPQTAPPDVMNGVVDALKAKLAARDAKCCATCRMLDNDTWFANEGDELATPYCAAHSCTCAPNGFDEWQPREGKP